MNPMKRSWILASASAFALVTSSPCWAEGAAAPAEALFEQGRRDMETKDYERACKKFRESDKLDPAPGTKLNLAVCEEARGRLATAWELFKSVERQLGPTDPRYPLAQKKRQDLEPQVPRLSLELDPAAPPRTTVVIGGVELEPGAFGIPLPLDPGEHELVIRAPGHAERTMTVELTRGRTTEARVAPGAALALPRAQKAKPAAQTPPPAPAPPPVRTERPSNSTLTLGFVFGGIGIAGMAAGTVTGLMALDRASTADQHCWDTPQPGCDQEGVDANSSGKTLAVVSPIALAVGVVGIGLGTYFIVTGDEGGPETGVVAQAGPHGGRLSLQRTW